MEDLEEAFQEVVQEERLLLFGKPSHALQYVQSNQVDVAFLYWIEQYAVGAFQLHAIGYL